MVWRLAEETVYVCVCVFHKHMLDIIKTEILITETSVKQSYFPSLNG